MLVEKNPQLEQWVAAVFDDARALDRGDVIKMDRIEELTGQVRYRSCHWTGIVRKLKRRFLEERGIELKSVVGIGYKLSTKGEQLHENNRDRQKRIVRQYNRGVKALTSLPPQELTIHQQSVRASKIDALVSARRRARRDLREQTVLWKKRPTIYAKPGANGQH